MTDEDDQGGADAAEAFEGCARNRLAVPTIVDTLLNLAFQVDGEDCRLGFWQRDEPVIIFLVGVNIKALGDFFTAVGIKP